MNQVLACESIDHLIIVAVKIRTKRKKVGRKLPW